MKLIVKILLSALAVMILSYLLPGVHVSNYIAAIIVAVILGLLNIVVKPILVILTLPVTIITLGLFLLVINAFIILFADGLIDGFAVDGFWWALIFSLLLSFLQSLFTSGLDDEKS
ncbi:putative membrane protein [Pustulibacterium marinum]|uniref:Putative membrane protein n=1 Tax=Pustulibacterium marinum TaxID=1224947 RepID=A0A1I7GRH1_9FLAO|nr:phage holin family protein [Pustulibacterium marinum]SFU50846.1 putative membrane protein [Pustulibacterium marinum]